MFLFFHAHLIHTHNNSIWNLRVEYVRTHDPKKILIQWLLVLDLVLVPEIWVSDF